MHQRSIYTFFDWLRDFGGVYAALHLFGCIFMTLYTFIISSPMTSLLIDSLFKRGNNKRVGRTNSSNASKSDFEIIKDRLTYKQRSCTICRNKKEKRMLAKAKQRTNQLLEIDKIIRTQMLVHVGFKMLFSKAERFLLRN